MITLSSIYQFAILDKQKQFYESIYQSRENNNNNSQESVFFKAENITPLSLDDQLLCDGPITVAESINAINGFKKDKTPGTDGFSAEFYKFFWPELRVEMLSSFHFAFQTGSLSIIQRRGVISLIPKKDKRVSMGLTVRRKTAKNLAVRRKNERILAVSRKKKLKKLTVKKSNHNRESKTRTKW